MTMLTTRSIHLKQGKTIPYSIQNIPVPCLLRQEFDSTKSIKHQTPLQSIHQFVLVHTSNKALELEIAPHSYLLATPQHSAIMKCKKWNVRMYHTPCVWKPRKPQTPIENPSITGKTNTVPMPNEKRKRPICTVLRPPPFAQQVLGLRHRPRSCLPKTCHHRRRTPRLLRLRLPCWHTSSHILSQLSISLFVHLHGKRTLDLCVITLRFSHQQRRSFPVQGVCRVRVSQQLWQEDLEDIDHVEHR